MPKFYQNSCSFTLEPGTVITVTTSNVAVVRSKHRGEFKETPYIAPLVSARNDGRFTFSHRKNQRGGRFVLFVPCKLTQGDMLEILWCDPNCACAVLLEQV